MFSFSPRPLEDILAILFAFVVATAIHEFMHAWTALQLGDTTARDQGRITLDPTSHFEPFGFFGMVMIAIGYPFIGWGKPVPVAPWKMTKLPRDQRRRGMALVALAGPASNVVQAAIGAVVLQVVVRNGIEIGGALSVLDWFVRINILLAAFNMIPVPPLDGFNILNGILPEFWGPVLAPLAKYGFLVLILLFFIGGRLGGSIVDSLIGPVQTSLRDLMYRGLF
jgi:Zn-dependent protease